MYEIYIKKQDGTVEYRGCHQGFKSKSECWLYLSRSCALDPIPDLSYEPLLGWKHGYCLWYDNIGFGIKHNVIDIRDKKFGNAAVFWLTTDGDLVDTEEEANITGLRAMVLTESLYCSGNLDSWRESVLYRLNYGPDA